MGQPAPFAVRPPRSAGAAVALELVLGLFGVFGVGNIYAGRAGLGVALMLSFWVLFWINVALVFLVIGWVTMPLTWVGYLIAGSLLAARGVENYNAGY
jgi:TM2 domain-containing membrane protein YozV